MDCLAYQEAMQLKLDGEPIANEEALRQHRRACSDCRALSAAVLQLERGLHLVSYPQPPSHLANRIVGEVLGQRRSVRRFQRAVYVAAALAAAILVAVVIGDNWRSRSLQNDNLIVSAYERPRPVAETASLEKNVADARTALISLVTRTADESVGSGRRLIPISVETPSIAGINVWQDTIDPPAKSLREAGQGMSTGLEPVADSARRAFNYFVRDLPMGSEQ